MEENFQIAEIIYKFLTGRANQEEKDQLQAWRALNPANESLFLKITDDRHQLDKMEVYRLFDMERAWEKLDLEEAIPVRVGWPQILKYAAMLLLPIAAGLLYFLSDTSDNDLTTIDAFVGPGNETATLILWDKREVFLDQVSGEIESPEQGVIIQNDSSGLFYEQQESDANAPKAIVYNELVTPRGGKYQVRLADQTSVWLNAASSIRFPVVFADSVREVFLVGEAFFDVAKGEKPFIVRTDETAITVLGTAFNVQAYPEEPAAAVTLVEGSVSLRTASASGTLNPLEQALISADGEIKISDVSVAPYTAWLSGRIAFNNADLATVMRRLARWYDFEYEFENVSARNYHFSARINDQQKMSDILRMLERTTDVNFQINDKTVVIK